MIEIVPNFPDSVVGLIAKGHVTKQDYEAVLIPAIEAALKRHDKIRIYYELGSQFAGIDPGAAWEDLKTGVGHLNRWERMAVVTDVDWIKHMLNAFRFVIPGDMRLFPTAQASEARAWIVA
jgi:SpoIIAA-like